MDEFIALFCAVFTKDNKKFKILVHAENPEQEYILTCSETFYFQDKLLKIIITKHSTKCGKETIFQHVFKNKKIKKRL